MRITQLEDNLYVLNKKDIKKDNDYILKYMKDKIKKLTKDGVFYIGGGYSDKRMESLASAEDATNYISELYNKYCEVQDG